MKTETKTNGTQARVNAEPQTVRQYQVEWRPRLMLTGQGWQQIAPVVAHEEQACGLLAAQVDMDGDAADHREYRVLETATRVVCLFAPQRELATPDLEQGRAPALKGKNPGGGKGKVGDGSGGREDGGI